MSSKFLFGTLLLSANLHAWEPGPSQPNAITGLSVDSEDRNDVISFFHCIHAASEGQNSLIDWTGNVTNCQPGTTSATFKDHVLRRINWYRAMAGVPADITFETSQNTISQEAALMMSRNNALSHNPPTSWSCYTSGGATAAQTGNLALGSYGVRSIDRYIEDQGASNNAVGHRRWILAPRVLQMGTGDIPASGNFASANCLKVIGSNRSPNPTDVVSAWPPKGFVPWQSVFERWSYSFTGADFSAANVTMTHNGETVPITIDSRADNGFGDNTIVWKAPTTLGAVTEDQTYTVTVSNIQGAGASSVTYDVTIIDPNTLATPLSISGPAEAPASGSNFTFNTLSAASAYQISVSQVSPNTTSEGAEDASSSYLIDGTADNVFRISSSPRSGSKCFHLTPPAFFESEFFELDRNFLTQENSVLQFYFREGFATSTTELRSQISLDGGSSWLTLWTKNGAGSSSSSYQEVNLPLSDYPNQTVRVRFETAHLSDSLFTPGSDSVGFRIDDISVQNSSLEVGENITTPPAHGSFTLNATTAGNDLNIGDSYLLKVRPIIGCRTFGFSQAFPVSIIEAPSDPSFSEWLASHPGLSGGIGDDPDHDGLPNGIEYVLRTNPQEVTSQSHLPPLTVNSDTTSMIVPNTLSLSGVNITLLTSPDLESWTTLESVTDGPDHIFTTPTNERAFFQLRVTESD